MFNKMIENKIRSLSKKDFFIYPDSFRQDKETLFFMVKGTQNKYLGIAGNKDIINSYGFSSGALPDIRMEDEGISIAFFEKNNTNLQKITRAFPSLLPSALGQKTSFGFGDRLGIATPAHIRVINQQGKILPVFAQQSVRELEKTHRSFRDVIGCAIWNIFQEGYRGSWGADADHIKDRRYFEISAEEGITMFTLDTSEVLDEKVLHMNTSSINSSYDLNSDLIKDSKNQYMEKRHNAGGYRFNFNEETVIKLALTYGKALDFVVEIFELLKSRKSSFDYEVSFDETNAETSPEAHYFIASWMKEKGVEFSSLALRFPGVFEKGIDYRGDINQFEESAKIHGEIARNIGGYRLSLHSGSDKFSVYPAFNKNTRGFFHIKTSGTSWLEAVRVIAVASPDLFKELFNIAIDTFEENKKAYHVNLDYKDLPKSIEHLKDEQFPDLIDDYNLRRAFHIAYGSILDRKREELYRVLFENESLQYKYLIYNFKKHFDALNN